MDTIFTVKADDLARLSSQEAVNFFRELLWAEATALGIGINLINVPTAITVKDGGIDAEVRDVPIAGGLGIIKQGLTRYQIKTGKFSLGGTKNIKEILFKEGTTELKPQVKSCLDQDGTLIIVLFGWDGPINESQLSEKFRIELVAIDQKYQNAKIEIFRQNQLMRFFSSFRSLSLRIRKLDNAAFQTHSNWARNRDMQGGFEREEVQNKFIMDLQTALRRNDAAIHCHIMGEPGIGKTRYVLEATRTSDLSPLVIYCGDAHKFRDSNLMNELLIEDNHFPIILVLDECDLEDRLYVWNRLEQCGQKMKLISIYSDFQSYSANTIFFEVPALGNNQISNIIQNYGIVKDEADHRADLCSGSPRVAHVIGLNLKNNPHEPLRSLENIWDRYIIGGDKGNSEEVRRRSLVLRHIALFKRFGFGRPSSAEVDIILKIIKRSSSQVDQATFEEVIDILRTRKILQGGHVLYITPKALHIKLWTDWWRIHGHSFDFDEFLLDLASTPQLLQWFFDMFKYAAQSGAATVIVSELLSENGPFQKYDFLQTQLGARFFLALMEASPQAALTCLQRTVGIWSKEKLLEFTMGRREVVWALERIAMWRELFTGAAQLLLTLGEAENETYANNASRTFTGLFSLAPGELAPTQAPPQERLSVLKEALKSSSKERRLLAIHACNTALEAQHFSRAIGAEYQGLRKVPDLWMPQTYGELFEAYRQVWKLLYNQLDIALVDEQQLIVTILLQRALGLGRYVALADMVIDTVGELIKKPYTDKKKILADIIRLLHYDGSQLPNHIRQRWEQLKDSLVGSDFSSQMKRYVGMNILEDSFDEQGNRVDQTQLHIEELARQTIESPQLLQPELPWLVTAEAQNGYRFGYALGQRDFSFSLLPTLLEAQQQATDNASVFFLGGYLRVLFEKDQARWEEQADLLAQDEILRVWLPELTWRSGLTDRAALRLLKLTEENAINIGYFRMFSAGRSIQAISEDIFQKWIHILLNSPHPYALSIVLGLYYTYYVDREDKYVLPEELSLNVLIHQSLLQSKREIRFDPTDHYHWTGIGRAYVQSYPESSLTLADWMLEHFGENDTILDHFSETLSVLNMIVEYHSQDVWLLIARRLGPKIENTRAYDITRWLRGESNSIGLQVSGALNLFSPETIWQWVDADVKHRAPYLASYVPKTLFRQEGQVCLAREVLMRYGERKDVRRAFSANYFSGNWWGPESLHYEEVKRDLLDFNKDEEDEHVRLWIDEHVAELDQFIQQAKMREERDTF